MVLLWCCDASRAEYRGTGDHVVVMSSYSSQGSEQGEEIILRFNGGLFGRLALKILMCAGRGAICLLQSDVIG